MLGRRALDNAWHILVDEEQHVTASLHDPVHRVVDGAPAVVQLVRDTVDDVPRAARERHGRCPPPAVDRERDANATDAAMDDRDEANERTLVDWEHIAVPATAKVYVNGDEFWAFLLRFVALPAATRLTVVVGGSDMSFPAEFFPGHSRRRPYFKNTMTPKLRKDEKELPQAYTGDISMTLEQFLADPRLVHLYVQNYDATGAMRAQHT